MFFCFASNHHTYMDGLSSTKTWIDRLSSTPTWIVCLPHKIPSLIPHTIFCQTGPPRQVDYFGDLRSKF